MDEFLFSRGSQSYSDIESAHDETPFFQGDIRVGGCAQCSGLCHKLVSIKLVSDQKRP